MEVPVGSCLTETSLYPGGEDEAKKDLERVTGWLEGAKEEKAFATKMGANNIEQLSEQVKTLTESLERIHKAVPPLKTEYMVLQDKASRYTLLSDSNNIRFGVDFKVVKNNNVFVHTRDIKYKFHACSENMNKVADEYKANKL